jgi:aminotransferase
MALLNPGDRVVLFEPYYGYHLNTLLAVGAVPVFVKTRPPDWNFELSDLKSAAESSRAIVVNTPSNPSGKVYSVTELEAIAKVATEHDLFVFTDEIYEHFIYDGRRHLSPAAFPGMAERTITISGFSKVFSITGWRIGYALSDPRWARMIGYINDLVYVCAPAPLQLGVARGILEIEPEYYASLVTEYRSKRDLIAGALEGAGLRPYVPRGAYYVMADISRLPGATSKEKVMYLLEKSGIACVPGDAFYHDSDGSNLARFCFAKADAELAEAAERLERLA